MISGANDPFWLIFLEAALAPEAWHLGLARGNAHELVERARKRRAFAIEIVFGTEATPNAVPKVSARLEALGACQSGSGDEPRFAHSLQMSPKLAAKEDGPAIYHGLPDNTAHTAETAQVVCIP